MKTVTQWWYINFRTFFEASIKIVRYNSYFYEVFAVVALTRRFLFTDLLYKKKSISVYFPFAALTVGGLTFSFRFVIFAYTFV